MAAMFIAALCFSSCDHNNGEDNNGGGGNGGGSNSGGGSNHEYPATADVIPKAVKDIDGNWYDAVRIGNQIWMAENLRTTRYANGIEIPLGDDGSKTLPQRYYPNNNITNVTKYGYLYNWPAVMHVAYSSNANPSGVQGICPDGWHVPSKAEWDKLTNYLEGQPTYWTNGNSDYIAKALASNHDWTQDLPDSISSQLAISPVYDPINSPGHNLSTNNATGFSAAPAGSSKGTGGFGYSAYFWSSTEEYDFGPFVIGLATCYPIVLSGKLPKDYGFSVRCVKD